MQDGNDDRDLTDESLDDVTGAGTAKISTKREDTLDELTKKRQKAAAKMVAPAPGIEGSKFGSGN
jgi:hypothetical protein